MKLLVASRNEDKLRELRAALPGWEIALLDAPAAPVEDGETFVDNARIKARHGREHAPPDAWVAGEDSGIEVAALGGRPGVQSARWAVDGVARLLAELGDAEDRRARYVSELVALAPDGVEHRATGTLEGEIAHAARGTEGFGYDPIFVPRGESRTVAELGNAWKAESSHRARAARALAERLTGASALLASAAMDAAQALRELMEVSSQITAAVVLDADGTVLASAPETAGERLAATTKELVAAAGELDADGNEVTRVEVELEEGALFVVREGGRTVAATTGPSPTSGLVVYDLRTCAQAIPAEEPKKRRSPRKPKEASE